MSDPICGRLNCTMFSSTSPSVLSWDSDPRDTTVFEDQMKLVRLVSSVTHLLQ